MNRVLSVNWSLRAIPLNPSLVAHIDKLCEQSSCLNILISSRGVLSLQAPSNKCVTYIDLSVSLLLNTSCLIAPLWLWLLPILLMDNNCFFPTDISVVKSCDPPKALIICFVNLPGPVFCNTPLLSGLLIISSIRLPNGCVLGAAAKNQLATLTMLSSVSTPTFLKNSLPLSKHASKPTINSCPLINESNGLLQNISASVYMPPFSHI